MWREQCIGGGWWCGGIVEWPCWISCIKPDWQHAYVTVEVVAHGWAHNLMLILFELAVIYTDSPWIKKANRLTQIIGYFMINIDSDSNTQNN